MPHLPDTVIVKVNLPDVQYSHENTAEKFNFKSNHQDDDKCNGKSVGDDHLPLLSRDGFGCECSPAPGNTSAGKDKGWH